jgi:hypothetical protein
MSADRLRCRQEDQRQEAPHPRRYTGLADARDRPRRRRPGPRRRRAADGELVRRLSVPDQALCRRRLPGTGVPECDETDSGARQMSRSSSDRIKPQASSHCPSAGSSNAPSLGSAAVDDWPRTGNASTTRPSPSCASPPSASCCENYAIPHDVLGQTLRSANGSANIVRASNIIIVCQWVRRSVHRPKRHL